VNGRPDEEAGRADRAKRRHGERRARALDTVCADGECHVGAVIHEEPRPVAAGRLPEPESRREKISRAHVLLPQLHGLEPGPEAGLDCLLERPRHLRPIGDEAEREA